MPTASACMHSSNLITYWRTQKCDLHDLARVCARRTLSTRPTQTSSDSTVQWSPQTRDVSDSPPATRRRDVPLASAKYDEPLIYRGSTYPGAHKTLQFRSAQHVVGTKLREALKEGKDVRELLGDEAHSQRRYGIAVGNNRHNRWVSDKLERVAAATSTMGKYNLTSVTSRYAQDRDLASELDEILHEDGQEVEPGETQEIATGFKPKWRDVIRQKKKTEAPSWETLNDFRRRLFRNPYARQLADPLRTCLFTGIRLPTQLMAQFNAKLDTKTGSAFAAPSEFEPSIRNWQAEGAYMLDGDPLTLHKAVPHIKSLQLDESAGDATRTSNGVQAPHSTLIESNLAVRPIRRHHANHGTPPWKPGEQNAQKKSQRSMDVARAKMFMLPNAPVLERFGQIRTARNRKAIPIIWRERLGSVVNTLNVRPDPVDYILKLLRRRTARFLANSAHSFQDVVMPLGDPELTGFLTASGVSSTIFKDAIGEEASEHASALVGTKDPAAILWLGDSWGDQFSYTDDTLCTEEPGDAERARVPRIPIYNMQQLLSRIEWDWLRALKWVDERGEHDSFFGTRQVLVKESIWSGRAIGLLWRLHLLTSPIRGKDTKIDGGERSPCP